MGKENAFLVHPNSLSAVLYPDAIRILAIPRYPTLVLTSTNSTTIFLSISSRCVVDLAALALAQTALQREQRPVSLHDLNHLGRPSLDLRSFRRVDSLSPRIAELGLVGLGDVQYTTFLQYSNVIHYSIP